MNERGSSMVLAILIMGILVITVLSTTLLLGAQKKEAAYHQRLLQAEQFAESGLQDALITLQSSSTWRAGFSQKAIKNGYYDVTLSTNSRPTITVSGYGASIAYVRRPFRTFSVKVDALPIPQAMYAAQGGGPGNPLTLQNGAVINSYNSDITPTPAVFGSNAVIWSNQKVQLQGSGTQVFGTCYYAGNPPPSTPGCLSVPAKSTYTLSIPAISYNNYPNENDDLTGLIPNTYYNPGNKQLNIPGGQSAVIQSGVYYFKGITIAGGGTLTVSITNGPVVIYDDTGNININGAFVNPSLYPGNLVIYGSGAVNINVTLNSTQKFYGVFYGNTLNTVNIASEMFGAVAGQALTIQTGGLLHQDLSLQRGPFASVRVYSGSWAALNQAR
jgi:hypothetical protein